MTAGFTSTEFWLAVVAFLVALVFAYFGLHWKDGVLLICSTVQFCVSIFSYSHSRGKAKAPRPYLPPHGKI